MHLEWLGYAVSYMFVHMSEQFTPKEKDFLIASDIMDITFKIQQWFDGAIPEELAPIKDEIQSVLDTGYCNGFFVNLTLH